MLYLRIWDVKRGNAIYIKTPTVNISRWISAPVRFQAGRYIQSPALSQDKMRIDKLDEVIITHPHPDHISDICNFLTLNPKFYVVQNT